MSKQQEFVEKRMAAHRAEVTNLAQDPILQAALAIRDQSIEVIARWNERRSETAVQTRPDRRSKSIMGRRQAD